MTRRMLLIEEQGGHARPVGAGRAELLRADTDEAAVALARRAEPDVVLIDTSVAALAGRALLSRVHRAAPGAVIVVADRRAGDRAMSEAPWLDQMVGSPPEAMRSVISSAPAAVPHDPGAASAARAIVTTVLRRWGCERLLDDAALVVSELVSNAVFHARGPVDVQVGLRPGMVRLAVRDRGDAVPDPVDPERHDRGGRGLRILSGIVEAWGITPTEDGKIVWADLAM